MGYILTLRRLALHLLALAFLLALAKPARANLSSNVVNFDTISTAGNGLYATVPNGYAGLNWTAFSAMNGSAANATFGPSGYGVANTSGANSAADLHGYTASFSSADGSPFNLASFELTAVSLDNLTVTVTGLNGSSVVYTDVFVASAITPTLFTTNFTNVTQVTFAPSATAQSAVDPAYYSTFGTPTSGSGFAGTTAIANFAIDDVSVSSGAPVPEPAGISLLAMAGIGLLRRRALR